MKTHSVLGFILALGLLGGCDGGPSDSTPVTELDDEQVVDLCEEFVSDYQISLTAEQVCTLSALFSATDEASCEAARDACLMDPPDLGYDDTDCSMVSASDFPATCTATVGDVRTCNGLQYEQVTEIYGRADCANAGTDMAPTSDELQARPSECDVLAACSM